jgi:Kef-type K+ transport system membrane component KefB
VGRRRRLRSDPAGLPIGHFPTLVLLTLGAAALAAELDVAAFLGTLVGRAGRLDAEVHRTFETVTLAVLAPVFFATAGLRADLTTLVDPTVDGLAAVTLAVATAGKFLGGAGVATLSGFGRLEAIGMGAGLNARGALELVVANVGLSLGVLTDATYATIVLVAVVTSVVAAPLLRWAFADRNSTGRRAGARGPGRKPLERRATASGPRIRRSCPAGRSRALRGRGRWSSTCGRCR